MAETVQVYFGMGANLGDRESNLVEALNRLAGTVDITRVSPVYETPPVGYADQPDFLNIACAGTTSLHPMELRDALKRIERSMGRDTEGGFRYGPRPLDIDILFYGDRVIEEGDLRIPHLEVPARAFVLLPLADIAPDLRHPQLGKTVGEMLAAVDTQGIRRLEHGLLSGYQRDVQAEPPQYSIGLDRVGLTDFHRIIRLASTGRPELLSASIDVWIDLASEEKGAHMSRFSSAVDEAIEDSLSKTAANVETFSQRIAQALLKTQGACRAEVHVQAEFPQTRRTPVSGLRSQEIYRLLGIAAANRQREVILVGVEAEGMTACPCAQEMMRERAQVRLLEDGLDENQIERVLDALPMPTHNQCGRGRLLVTAHPSIRAEQLARIVEGSMSSETYEILKRPDECFVVNRAHNNPKFVEDVARDILGRFVEAYPKLSDDSFVHVRQTNLETIHKHSVFAERTGWLGDIRREISDGGSASTPLDLRRYLDLQLQGES